jgi:hypothetical protein
MNPQELRALQEAYMEVVENQQLNVGYRNFPYDKVKAKVKKLAPGRDDLGREPLTGPKAPNTPQKDLDRATTLRLAAHLHHSEGPKQRERINKGPESLLYKKRSKTVSDNTEKKKSFPNRLTRSDKQGIKDSYDLYDIILSHLLDEGYAETQEQAEVIMVNMSEEWRESICEEKMAKSPRNQKKTEEKTKQRTDRRKRIQYYGKDEVGHGTGEHLRPFGK